VNIRTYMIEHTSIVVIQFLNMFTFKYVAEFSHKID